MRLSTLLAALPVPPLAALSADPDVASLTADSRQVAPGGLFVAVRGEHFDGHRFIPQALQKGAAVIVAESGAAEAAGAERQSAVFVTVPDTREALAWLAAAWHGRPARQLVMVGVTGTDGKTTTASLIHAILLAAGRRAGLISTVSAIIGDETVDTGFHVTTPEALEVQGYLARMAAAGLTHCVLEVTSHGLEQQRVTGCEFDVAVVTNITHEHLDFHKSYANYRAAKGRLVAGLATAAAKPGGPAKTAVLNVDDGAYGYLAGLLEQAPQVRRITYSLRPGADVWAEGVAQTSAGLSFTAHGPDCRLPARAALMGAYNVSNCLAAMAATVAALGVAPEAAQRGLAGLAGVPGRMERIDLGQPFTAIVDFAHTPNALRRTLETARALAQAGQPGRPEGRVIVVFGSAGLRDVEKRRLMAEAAAELADLSVLTAEDPRTEALDDILAMMAGAARLKGAVEGETFFRVPDRGQALRLAVALARPGDIVLACGKGHEQSMCFGQLEYAWDDRTALRAALAEQLGQPGPKMPYLPTQATRPSGA
ncbi:MAG: UDP-N-acetylmuramoyl-L-alanyl-D-glutamate--2,6-diaminopimelate ligase [Anaerolineales bacterium]|nr:UDP-N-acetylmuramoyl-L-alanyl-D-glutamate--2,6-diaminopimelate ligase [Anaerolineales bacterium]